MSGLEYLTACVVAGASILLAWYVFRHELAQLGDWLDERDAQNRESDD